MSGHLSELGGAYTTGACQLIQERTPIRTLLVDDTPDILQVICALLSTDDRIEIIGRATDGSEALEAVGSLRPDLVLMDVQMPIMDGLTAATLIRLKFPEVSIVLMSAYPSHLIDNQIHASGADAFIDKLEFGEIFPRVLSGLRTADQTRV